MGVFQASVGYRDPAKSMTLKALEARLKATQEASANATQMTQPVSDPMQGYAYLGNILASGIKEGMAGGAAADARDQLAKIKAGIDWNKGMTPEQYAAASSIDPDWADKTQQDWVNYRQDMEKQAKQNEFTTKERLGGQEFQAGEHRTEEAAREAAAISEDQRTADQKLADEQRARENIAKDADARMEEGKKLGLTGEELQRYALTGNMPQDPLLKGNVIKDVTEMKSKAGSYDNNLNSLSYAGELIDKMPANMTAGNLELIKNAMKIPTIAGYGGDTVLAGLMKANGWTKEQVDAAMEFDRILGQEANTRMSQTLKGATTDKEMANFQNTINNPSATPDQKRAAIKRMMSAILTDRSILSNTLVQQYHDDALPSWTYDRGSITGNLPTTSTPGTTTTPPDQGGGDGTTTTPAPAPETSAGGGGSTTTSPKTKKRFKVTVTPGSG